MMRMFITTGIVSELLVALSAGSILFRDRAFIVFAEPQLVVGRCVVHAVAGQTSHFTLLIAGG